MTGKNQPPEFMFKILNKLDRESLLNASKVSVEWKKNAHDLLSIPMNKNHELKEKLEKCGWIMGDHDVKNCDCIEKNMRMFKLVEDCPLSFKQVYDPYYDNLYEKYWSIDSSAVSKSKLFIYEHWDCYFCKCNWSTSHIKVIDLTKDPQNGGGSKELDHRHEMDLKHVSLDAHDNTLVAAYYFDSTSFDSSGISTKQKIKLWNTESGDYGYEFNFLEHVDVDKTDKSIKYTAYLRKVGLDVDKLALNVEIKVDDKLHGVQTIIWRINTNNPSTDNTGFLAKISHSTDFPITKGLSVLMNAQYICRIFSTEESKKIEVTNYDQPQAISTHTTDDVFAPEFLDHGKSSKLYVYNMKTMSINLYDIANGGLHCVFNFDLNSLVDRGGDCFFNFIPHHGKLILIRKVCLAGEIQFFILTEDGQMIDGARVKLTRPIAFKVRSPFYFDVNGIVAITKEDAWKL